MSPPPEWIRLPDPDAAEAVGWPLDVAALADGPDRVPLALTLAESLAMAGADRREGRVDLVLLDDPPVDVRAWASADLGERPLLDADAAADLLAAAAAEQSGHGALAGSVTRQELDGDPIVVQQELPIAPRTGAVVHRVVVTRFPRATTTAMRLTVTTDRLVAVPDLRGTALALAARIDPIPRGAS